jgi:hypothetical protein
VQQPSDHYSAGKEQEKEQRQRHVQRPKEEPHFSNGDILNQEENRQAREY